MKTKYLGKVNEKWTLSDNTIGMRRFFPRPISVILPDEAMGEFQNEFDRALRRCYGDRDYKIKVKKVLGRKLHLGTQSGRFGSRTILAAIGNGKNEISEPWYMFFNSVNYRDNVLIKDCHDENCVVFYCDSYNDKYTIYVL